jgi:uncharacterized membrane protein YgdD (TMEM256/DUF423 family)
VDRALLVVAALFGFAGVAVGAFGAHALRDRLPPERLAHVETAVRYLFFTLPGLLFAGWMVAAGRSASFAVAGWAFVAGIVVFSGSLLALAITGTRRWGAVTPIGGVAMLVGWLALAIACTQLAL